MGEINRPHARRGEEGCKLRTYALFKKGCSLEPYLKWVDDQAKCRLMARFRMGVAPLRIEQGRYKANGRNDGSHGIPSEQRMCQVCAGVVGMKYIFYYNVMSTGFCFMHAWSLHLVKP